MLHLYLLRDDKIAKQCGQDVVHPKLELLFF